MTFSVIVDKIVDYILFDVTSSTYLPYISNIENQQNIRELCKIEIANDLFDFMKVLDFRIFVYMCNEKGVDEKSDASEKIAVLEQYVIPFNFLKYILNYKKNPEIVFPQPNLYQRIIDICIPHFA